MLCVCFLGEQADKRKAEAKKKAAAKKEAKGKAKAKGRKAKGVKQEVKTEKVGVFAALAAKVEEEGMEEEECPFDSDENLDIDGDWLDDKEEEESPK